MRANVCHAVLCFWYGTFQQNMRSSLLTAMLIKVSCMMTISLSLSSSGPSHFGLVQVIPSWAIWLCKSHIGPDQSQLSRCSTGTDMVTSEGYHRQEQLCSDTVFTSDSPLDTSVITSESQWHVVRLTEGPPANFTANPGTCTQGNAQFPWVSRATGTTNNIKNINTGMRRHLVTRPANTPLGNVPAPLVH